MNEEPGVVPGSAVRPITTEQALRLDLPHAVAIRLGSAWRQVWLLGHDRGVDAVTFLVQRRDAGGVGEPLWLEDVEVGEIAPATAPRLRERAP